MSRQQRLDVPGSLHHGYGGVRRMVCQVAVDKMGYPGAEVPRAFGVTIPAVVRAAQAEGCRESGNICKFTRKLRPLFLDSFDENPQK